MSSSFEISSKQSDEESKPLWKYVTKYDKADGVVGGNTQWQYNFCMKVYTSSYTKVRAHLLKIKGAGIGVCLLSGFCFNGFL